ncbi:MAG TPA: DUF1552 domain-containing protein [Humisphaera sp.]
MTDRPATPNVSRRALLRGAGAMLALPFLESFAVQAARAAGVSAAAQAAAAAPPLRMGIFSVTGGTVLESWKMKAAGPLAGPLPSILRSLEFARQDMLLLTGLAHTGKSEGLNGHESCAFAHLTGAPVIKKEAGKPVAGVSVDQAAAAVAGRETFLPSIEAGLSTGETKYSFRSATEPVPYEADPRLVFERMFRGRTPVVPNWQRRAAAAQARNVRTSASGKSYDKAVVDLVMAEAADLRKTLGTADRQKLDEYLVSVQAMETRIGSLEARLAEEALDLKNPGPSRLVAPNMMSKETNFGRFRNQLHQDPALHAEYIRLVADLMVLAFQTDTTRVMTLAVGSDEAMFPGVVTVGYERHCHTLEHQGNAGRPEDADPIAREALRQVHAWYTTLFAEMVRKMKAIDEGNGTTLLDNSMLLYTSYMADGGHGRNDYPALLVGKAGGRLKTGRQVEFQKNTPVSNLYVEMLANMGVRADGFGDSKTSKFQAYDGRLPGLA